MSLSLGSRSRRFAIALLFPMVVQCDKSTTSPVTPEEIRSIAIHLRVDVAGNAVSAIAQPSTPAGASFSMVGTDGVHLATSNMTRTPAGGPRSLVRFDVAITNALSSVGLVAPTFPRPPAGTHGLLLFPYEATVVQGRAGTIAPSTDWDGAPHSFFNDTHCGGASTSDCFRWEEFAAPLAPGATSVARTVGFIVDNDVQVFDVVMVLAADLVQMAPPPSIELSASTAAFSATQNGASPAAQTVSITNAGGQTLSDLAATVSYADGQTTGWLDAALSATTAPATLTLTPTTGSLAAGTYDATVSVAAPGANNSPRSIAVTFVVGPPPVIALSNTSISFTAADGTIDPAVATINVTNAGGGSLTGLTLSSEFPVAGVQAKLSTTTAPTVVTLTPFVGGLRDGSYTGSLTISAAGAANGPQTVSLSMTISGSPTADVIYVSESDLNAFDDASCGTGFFGGSFGHACRSITVGLMRAVARNKKEIRVADGHYTESVTLVPGIDLLGGYRPDTWLRHVGTTNTIIDGVSSAPGTNHDRTVIATGITSPTVFEGFVVRGSTNAKPGGNSYAMYVANSSDKLVIRNNLIYGGVGGPGVSGVAGGGALPAVNGVGRASNPDLAYDAKEATGTGACNTSNDRSYANGGVRSYGVNNVSGGNGGGNRCPPSGDFSQYSARDGNPGFAGGGAGGGAAGAGGDGGLDSYLVLDLSGQTSCIVSNSLAVLPHAGSDGGRGGDGADGTPAAGGGSASVVGGHWSAIGGGNGVSGGNGGGGGGGGAGGGAKCVTCERLKDQLGAHGGGGGSGGGGGQGGTGGTSGGAAFGIFIVGSSTAAPTITGNTIVRGNGGNGGVGGSGTPGQAGGRGAPGGLSNLLCASPAGRGGDGGNGGSGSGGGGGSGGSSFGIYTSGAGTPTYCVASSGNVVSGGRGGDGGAGGSSLGNPGGAGVAGAVTSCEFH